ncbi:MAG: carbohydrate ABC transporter permease [Lachnospiraceae bacterium]|nr:carbohydrate ABC transporter permease [Lachnospiraceae bacterium]
MNISVDAVNDKKDNEKRKLVSGLIYGFLILLALIYILPLVWVVITSLKDDNVLMTSPWAMPEKLRFDNYSYAWTMGNLGRATLNSFIVCSVTLLISMIVGAMAAFAIARLRFKFSKLILTYFMIGMMIPVHCVLIPLFIQFSSWKLTNSLIGLIIPYVTFSLPITIYIMVGFFEGIPNELFEAAVIDGCSIPRMFITVALPMAKTGFMVTGLMSFISNWNELLLAMVFISKETFKTLPVSLTKFVGPYHTNYTQMFAGIMIAVIPTIIVYCIFANQIVEGLTAGAVKG